MCGLCKELKEKRNGGEQALRVEDATLLSVSKTVLPLALLPASWARANSSVGVLMMKCDAIIEVE